MSEFTDLKRDLLAECEDDHVGLWAVIRYVEDQMPEADEAKLRQATLALLKDLLGTGQIQAGFPDSNGRDFHPWPFPTETVIQHIESRWKLDSPRPRPGEIVWFTTPAESVA